MKYYLKRSYDGAFLKDIEVSRFRARVEVTTEKSEAMVYDSMCAAHAIADELLERLHYKFQVCETEGGGWDDIAKEFNIAEHKVPIGAPPLIFHNWLVENFYPPKRR